MQAVRDQERPVQSSVISDYTRESLKVAAELKASSNAGYSASDCSVLSLSGGIRPARSRTFDQRGLLLAQRRRLHTSTTGECSLPRSRFLPASGCLLPNLRRQVHLAAKFQFNRVERLARAARIRGLCEVHAGWVRTCSPDASRPAEHGPALGAWGALGRDRAGHRTGGTATQTINRREVSERKLQA